MGNSCEKKRSEDTPTLKGMKNEISLIPCSTGIENDNTFSKQSDITNFPRISGINSRDNSSDKAKQMECYNRMDSLVSNNIPSIDLEIVIPITDPIKTITSLGAITRPRIKPVKKNYGRSLSPDIIRIRHSENLEAPSSAELLKLKRIRHQGSILKERGYSGTLGTASENNKNLLSSESIEQRSIKKVHFNEVVRIKKYPRTKSAVS